MGRLIEIRFNRCGLFLCSRDLGDEAKPRLRRPKPIQQVSVNLDHFYRENVLTTLYSQGVLFIQQVLTYNIFIMYQVDHRH